MTIKSKENWMPRLAIPGRDDVPDASREALDNIHKTMGKVPNEYRLIGTNTEVLDGYMSMVVSVSKVLGHKLVEQISLAVSQLNGSDYDLSKHRYLALNHARIMPAEIELNRQGTSIDAKAAAAIEFALVVATKRGHIEDDDLGRIRSVGFNDSDIIAIVSATTIATMTNLLNSVARTEIDFPLLRCDESDSDL
jgi:AhpD family alkylhydroperoxidase